MELCRDVVSVDDPRATKGKSLLNRAVLDLNLPPPDLDLASTGIDVGSSLVAAESPASPGSGRALTGSWHHLADTAPAQANAFSSSLPQADQARLPFREAKGGELLARERQAGSALEGWSTHGSAHDAALGKLANNYPKPAAQRVSPKFQSPESGTPVLRILSDLPREDLSEAPHAPGKEQGAVFGITSEVAACRCTQGSESQLPKSVQPTLPPCQTSGFPPAVQADDVARLAAESRIPSIEDALKKAVEHVTRKTAPASLDLTTVGSASLAPVVPSGTGANAFQVLTRQESGDVAGGALIPNELLGYSSKNHFVFILDELWERGVTFGMDRLLGSSDDSVVQASCAAPVASAASSEAAREGQGGGSGRAKSDVVLVRAAGTTIGCASLSSRLASALESIMGDRHEAQTQDNGEPGCSSHKWHSGAEASLSLASKPRDLSAGATSKGAIGALAGSPPSSSSEEASHSLKLVPRKRSLPEGALAGLVELKRAAETRLRPDGLVALASGLDQRGEFGQVLALASDVQTGAGVLRMEPLPRGITLKFSQRTAGMFIVDRLNELAQALEQGNTNLFKNLYSQLKVYGRAGGSASQRAVYHTLVALMCRKEGGGLNFANKVSNHTVQDMDTARKWYFTASPTFPFSIMASLGQLVHKLRGRRKVHLVVMGLVPLCPVITKLLAQDETGACRLKSIRFTFVNVYPLVVPHRRDLNTMRSLGLGGIATGQVAAALGLEYSFQVVDITDDAFDWMGVIQRKEGEALAMCICDELSLLHDLPGFSGGLRLQLFQTLKRLDVDVLTVVEREMPNASSELFLPRFQACFQHIWASCHAHDTLVKPSPKFLRIMEHNAFAIRLVGAISVEGLIRRWRPGSAGQMHETIVACGLRPVKIQDTVIAILNDMIRSYPKGFGIQSSELCVKITWENSPLWWAASWTGHD